MARPEVADGGIACNIVVLQLRVWVGCENLLTI